MRSHRRARLAAHQRAHLSLEMPRGFGRGRFGMRRGGMLLLGMGMGMGSPRMNSLMTGGISYLLGRDSNQPASQQVQQLPPSYQSSQESQAALAPKPSSDSEKLA
jgi:hypothetical protein